MSRMVSRMCPNACGGRGACYSSTSGPLCVCRDGFFGDSCQYILEATSTVVADATDSTDFWSILLVSLLVLFSLLGCCGAIVWYFRSKNGDRIGGLDEISSKAKVAPKKIKEYLENLV